MYKVHFTRDLIKTFQNNHIHGFTMGSAALTDWQTMAGPTHEKGRTRTRIADKYPDADRVRPQYPSR